MLPEPLDVAAIGADLARTLTYLHRLGHAHLDLSPTVVKNTPEGTIIVDLKYALPIGDEQVRFYDLHRRGAIAPEQLRGEPAAAAMDVYALGALLFQAATGQLILHRDSSRSGEARIASTPRAGGDHLADVGSRPRGPADGQAGPQSDPTTARSAST